MSRESRNLSTLVVFGVLALVLLMGSFSTQAATTLRFVHWYLPETDNGQALEELLQAFSEENPDIKVEAEYVAWGDFASRVLVQVAGGMAPEISLVSGSWFGDFARTGIFLPIDPNRMRDFYPGSAEQAFYAGQYYAVPFAGGPQRGVWYHEDMFLEAGLDPDMPPETWDLLESYARRLVRVDANGTVTRYALNIDNFLDMFAASNGAQQMLDDGSKVLWDSREYVEALEFMVRLKERNLSGSISQSAFLGGQAAMYTRGPWVRHLYESQVGLELRFGAFPLNSPEGKYLMSADAVAVYASTPEKEAAAWRLLDYMTSPEVQANWAIRTGFPPMNLQGVRSPIYLEYVRDHPIQWITSEMMENIVVRAPLRDASALFDLQQQWVIEALNFNVAPSTALDNAAREANAILAGF